MTPRTSSPASASSRSSWRAASSTATGSARRRPKPRRDGHLVLVRTAPEGFAVPPAHDRRDLAPLPRRPRELVLLDPGGASRTSSSATTSRQGMSWSSSCRPARGWRAARPGGGPVRQDDGPGFTPGCFEAGTPPNWSPAGPRGGGDPALTRRRMPPSVRPFTGPAFRSHTDGSARPPNPHPHRRLGGS